MNSRWFIAFKCLLQFSVVAAVLVAMPAYSQTPSSKNIVVFGDSLSAAYNIKQDEGWVALLQLRLTQQNLNYRVINASISGETTSGGLSRFADMLKTQKPNVVILELGANDGLRGLSANETYNNLNAMMQQAKNKKAKIILVGMKIPPNYGLKYSRQFSENYQKLAKKHSAALVPFMLDGVAGNANLMQADGLHPTAAAQPKILANIWPILMSAIKK